jgi:hypothetical protein
MTDGRWRTMAGLGVATVLSVAGSGCAPMSDAHLYEIAVPAVEAEATLPEGAVALPREQAEFYVGKNAACVIVPHALADRDGEAVARHTVWLKRIGTRWELDRLFPTPVYPPADRP